MRQLRNISHPMIIIALVLCLWGLGCAPELPLEQTDLIFSKFYGGGLPEESGGFTATQDGGWLLAGASQTFSNGGWDVFLVKTDGNGNQLWEVNLGSGSNEKAADVVALADGGFLVIGERENLLGQADLLALKINADGDTVWTQTYGLNDRDERAKALIPTSDGGFALLGDQFQADGLLADIFVVKIDANGQEDWSNTYGFQGQESGKRIFQDADGNFYLLATTDRTGEKKMMVVKTDVDGNDLSYLNFGPEGNIIAQDWAWGEDGVFLCGTLEDTLNQHAVVVRLDELFFEAWTYEGNPGTTARAIGLLPNGNSVFAGISPGIIPANSQLSLEILNPNGNPVADTPFELGGTNTVEIIDRLRVNNDGTIILCGTTSFAENPMIWLLKGDPQNE